MRRLLLAALAFLVFLLPLAHASYYADIEADVGPSGTVSVTGVTNHPSLLAESARHYTSMDKGVWLLNLTAGGEFTDFVYKVSLPPGSSIIYVASTGSFRIGEESGRLTVFGHGGGTPFSVVVQYQLRGREPFSLALLLAALLAAAALAAFVLRKKARPRFAGKKLSERQKAIVGLLVREGKPVTQATLEKELGMPKASLSRNLASLEIKGVIEREKAGMANLVRLKK